jgi:hypothetical protein
MKAIAIVTAVVLASAPAAAQPSMTPAESVETVESSPPARPRGAFFELGLGSPGGMTFGLGADVGRWRAFVDAGGIALGMAALLTVQASVQRELRRWDRTTLGAGVTGSLAGFIAGSDEMAAGTFRALGPVLAVRRTMTRRTDLAVDVGSLFGSCRGDCDDRPYVSLHLTARLAVHF